MEGAFQLVKLVTGNGGSKRITIPKEIVEKLKIKDADYVAILCEGGRKATISPVTVFIEGEDKALRKER